VVLVDGHDLCDRRPLLPAGIRPDDSEPTLFVRRNRQRPDVEFDQLQARGISWTYYSSEALPFLPLPDYFAHIRNDPAMAGRIAPTNQLKSDIESGNLAQVVYLDTEFDPFISEHPPENVTIGELWTQDIVRSIEVSPIWNSTAIFLTYDESGGYYDHLAPPQVDPWGYGFRVPMIVISPYAKRAHVDSDVMDHTSIMKFIASNWGLPSLTVREGGANDLFSAFNFPLVVNRTPVLQLSTATDFGGAASGGTGGSAIVVTRTTAVVSKSRSEFPAGGGVHP
jgi:phospholipase C